MSDMQLLQARLLATRQSIEAMRLYLLWKNPGAAIFAINCLKWRESDLICKINRCMEERVLLAKGVPE